MKVYLYAMVLLLWIPTCSAQDVDMTKVCEDAASSAGGDAATQADLRATCLQAAQCAASCNNVMNDSDAFTACIEKCTLPNGNAVPKPKSSDDADSKKDAKDDKGDLCKQAGDFRDHELFQLWDTEQKKYAIFTEGSNTQVELRDKTAKLMDDDWWAGSTSADISVEIKGFTDIVNDTIGLFAPEAQIGASTIHHAREIADGVTSIGVLATYTKDNAEAAAKQAGAEVFAKYGGPVGSTTKLLMDTAEYAKTKKDAEQYREAVQAQVRRINETLKTLDEKRKAAIEKMDAYQEIVNGIDMMCANKSQKTSDGSVSTPVSAPN